MKRAVIVHGWSDSPEGSWFPWLKHELEAAGYSVTVPAMPDPDEPKIKEWIAALREAVGEPDAALTLVGHSVGCQTILRYLTTLPNGVRAGRVVLVAPWFTLSNLGSDEEAVAKPWLSTPIDLARACRSAESFAAIISTDDPYVPLEPTRSMLSVALGASVKTLEGKGHLWGEDGVTELPEVLDEVIR